MKKLYFVLTHYNADRATRFNVRLLTAYTAFLYRHGFETHVVVLTTGTTLQPGNGEEVFVPLPNLGHTDGDVEMFNLGVTLALGRGADLIVKLSGNRIFLNPARLLDLLQRLERSDREMLSDQWIREQDYATDVVFMKAQLATRLVPLPVLSQMIVEARLYRRIDELGLRDKVMLYPERQPVHIDNGGRRTRFYDEIELLTNTEQDLETFIRDRYPQYLELLRNDSRGAASSHLSWLDAFRPTADPTLTLERADSGYHLYNERGAIIASLNDSAALVWSLCEGRRSCRDIVSEIERELNLEAGSAADDIRQSIAGFLDQGLVSIEHSIN